MANGTPDIQKLRTGEQAVYRYAPETLKFRAYQAQMLKEYEAERKKLQAQMEAEQRAEQARQAQAQQAQISAEAQAKINADRKKLINELDNKGDRYKRLEGEARKRYAQTGDPYDKAEIYKYDALGDLYRNAEKALRNGADINSVERYIRKGRNQIKDSYRDTKIQIEEFNAQVEEQQRVYAPPAPTQPETIYLGGAKPPEEGVIVLQPKHKQPSLLSKVIDFLTFSPAELISTQQMIYTGVKKAGEKAIEKIEQAKNWVYELTDPAKKEQRINMEKSIQMLNSMSKNYENDSEGLNKEISNFENKYGGKTLDQKTYNQAMQEKAVLDIKIAELDTRRQKLLSLGEIIENKVLKYEDYFQPYIFTEKPKEEGVIYLGEPKKTLAGFDKEKYLRGIAYGAIGFYPSLAQLGVGLVTRPLPTAGKAIKGIFYDLPKSLLTPETSAQAQAELLGNIFAGWVGGAIIGKIKGKIDVKKSAEAINRAKVSPPKITEIRTEAQIKALEIPEGMTLSEATLKGYLQKDFIIRKIVTALKPATKADAKYIPNVKGTFFEIIDRKGNIIERTTLGTSISKLAKKVHTDITIGQAIGKLTQEEATYYGGYFTGSIGKRFDPVSGKIYDIYTGQVLKTIEKARLVKLTKKGLSEAEIIAGELRLRKPAVTLKESIKEPEFLGFAEKQAIKKGWKDIAEEFKNADPFIRSLSFTIRKVTKGKYEIFYKPTNQRFIVTRQTLNKFGLGRAWIQQLKPISEIGKPKAPPKGRPPYEHPKPPKIPPNIKRNLARLSKADKDFAFGQILAEQKRTGKFKPVREALKPLRKVKYKPKKPALVEFVEIEKPKPPIEGEGMPFMVGGKGIDAEYYRQQQILTRQYQENIIGKILKPVPTEKIPAVPSIPVMATFQSALGASAEILPKVAMQQGLRLGTGLGLLTGTQVISKQQLQLRQQLGLKQDFGVKQLSKQQLGIKQQYGVIQEFGVKQISKQQIGLKQQLGLKQITIPAIGFVPYSPPPSVTITKTPPPAILPRKESKEDKKRRLKYEAQLRKQQSAYQSSVASAFLQSKARKVTRKQLARLERKVYTGLEIRPLVELKESKRIAGNINKMFRLT
jgi:hypothetical protein